MDFSKPPRGSERRAGNRWAMPLLDWLHVVQEPHLHQSGLREFLVKQVELQAILCQQAHRMPVEHQGVLRERLPLALAEVVLSDSAIIEREPAFVAHLTEATRYLYVGRSAASSQINAVRVWDDVEK
eukprot:6700018-Prymnesium_polylepis.1